MEVVASLSQGRTAAAQCGLFTYKSVPVIFEPPCTMGSPLIKHCVTLIFCALLALTNDSLIFFILSSRPFQFSVTLGLILRRIQREMINSHRTCKVPVSLVRY